MIDDDDGDDDNDGMVSADEAQRYVCVKIFMLKLIHNVLRFLGTCTHYKLVCIGTHPHTHTQRNSIIACWQTSSVFNHISGLVTVFDCVGHVLLL